MDFWKLLYQQLLKTGAFSSPATLWMIHCNMSLFLVFFWFILLVFYCDWGAHFGVIWVCFALLFSPLEHLFKEKHMRYSHCTSVTSHCSITPIFIGVIFFCSKHQCSMYAVLLNKTFAFFFFCYLNFKTWRYFESNWDGFTSLNSFITVFVSFIQKKPACSCAEYVWISIAYLRYCSHT